MMFAGSCCYHGREAAHLAAHGFEDLLVAYPVLHRGELEAVCAAVADGTTVTLMVDEPAHVGRAAAVAAESGVDLPLCIDVDMSTEHLGIYFGVRRSTVRTPADALALAETIADADNVHLAGVMGYEAQLAGLPDRNPSNGRLFDAAVRAFKRVAKPRIERRRRNVVDALADAGYDLRFVNGGGTGSVEFTVGDGAVTEVTVGSGFFAPRLFDHYDAFQHEPAAGYAIEVTRRPAPDVYTCRGGGYVASGPPGADKAPGVALPTDAAVTDREGAGEVQTPVRYDGLVTLSLGDPIVMRHAKAGELSRQFDSLALVADGEIRRTLPTYRGDGEWYG